MDIQEEKEKEYVVKMMLSFREVRKEDKWAWYQPSQQIIKVVSFPVESKIKIIFYPDTAMTVDIAVVKGLEMCCGSNPFTGKDGKFTLPFSFDESYFTEEHRKLPWACKDKRFIHKEITICQTTKSVGYDQLVIWLK